MKHVLLLLTTGPNGSSPIAVASKVVSTALSGNIGDTVGLAVHSHGERLVAMDFGKRADTVRREELFLVKHVAQNPGQLVFGGDGQKMAELSLPQVVQVRDLVKERGRKKVSVRVPPPV